MREIALSPMAEKRKYRLQRKRLVEELHERGIDDENVLRAIAAVPRHEFVEPALRNRAYRDEALPIGKRQTISQPFTVAYQSMLLEVQPGDRVLEVGTGSGYQAAVLCELGARVFTIERHRPLLDRAVDILEQLDYRVVSRVGDGTLGWQSFAPYDGIVVTAAAADVPQPLLEQLRLPDDDTPGGRLVVPVGTQDGQVMMRITRTGQESFEREGFHRFRFVPLVGAEGGLEHPEAS